MSTFWDVFWIMLVSFVFISYPMLLFHIVVDLVRDDAVSGWGKAFWSIFLIFLPILGSLVYLIARGSGMTERTLRQAQKYQDQQSEYIRSVAGGTADPVGNLAQAKSLLDSGAITEDEFETIKTKALA